MNGMHHRSGYAYEIGGDSYSASWHYELAPKSTLAQLSLTSYFEFDDETKVDLGFTSCQFIDSNGVQRTDSFPDIDLIDGVVHKFGRNKLVRVDWEMRVRDVHASWLLNLFYWDHVS